MQMMRRKMHASGAIHVYGAALGYFLVTNMLRIGMLLGSGDDTYFQADYALPPLFLWVAMRLRAPRWAVFTGTFLIALVVLGSDTLVVLGRRFRWGPDAVPQYLLAYHDLPWLLIAPIAMCVIAIALISTVLLLARRSRLIVIWPMIAFMGALLTTDMIVGTGRYRSVAGGVNLITTSRLSLVSTYVGMISGSAVSVMRRDTMWSMAMRSPPPPRQILSVALESYGLPRRADQRAALIRPLLRELGATYDVRQAAHPFFGSTFQGEVRELCGLRLVGYPDRKRLAGRFTRCLPARLRQLGYDTWALHGNGGQFYSRKTFYPLMGFRHAEFYDQLRAAFSAARSCDGTVFRGVCDEQVYARATRLFDGSKRFVHVMTLDTHLPVRSAEPPSCSTEYAGDPALCGYDLLMGRSLTQLGRALARATIKPDVVYVYGDHAPPFATQASRQVFDAGRVPFLTLTRRRVPHDAPAGLVAR